MRIYSYEEAFGAVDLTSRPMRRAIGQWFDAYYGNAEDGADPCQRVAYTVVSKLVRTVLGEYQAVSQDPFCQAVLTKLGEKTRQAMEMSLVGGECYIKPCPEKAGFSFTLIPRDHVLVFGRDAAGHVTDMGTVEQSVRKASLA